MNLRQQTKSRQSVPKEGPKFRGQHARELESSGEIFFRVVKNHGKRDELEYLTAMKAIVSRHLPNMALDYISRIVYDPIYHETLLLIRRKENTPFGGICFRPFPEQGFVEIVFCAIESNQQTGGFGSHMMSHLKEVIQRRQIYHILTYADNQAIGYFVKQGFRKHITLEKERWQGYIKDYVDATLMECVLHPGIESYTDVPSTIKRQREELHRLINEVAEARMSAPPLAFPGKLTRYM